jgi:cell division protein FtsX
MRLLNYVIRNILRNRLRSLLTVSGVAISLFLFSFILNVNSGIRGMVEKSASDQTLVVFQKNRY